MTLSFYKIDRTCPLMSYLAEFTEIYNRMNEVTQHKIKLVLLELLQSCFCGIFMIFSPPTCVKNSNSFISSEKSTFLCASDDILIIE